jgi:hypothetical protein
MAGLAAATERSRGYCLELVCADSLTGRGEESNPEEILMVIDRLVHLLPEEYQASFKDQDRGREAETAAGC